MPVWYARDRLIDKMRLTNVFVYRFPFPVEVLDVEDSRRCCPYGYYAVYQTAVLLKLRAVPSFIVHSF